VEEARRGQGEQIELCSFAILNSMILKTRGEFGLVLVNSDLFFSDSLGALLPLRGAILDCFKHIILRKEKLTVAQCQGPKVGISLLPQFALLNSGSHKANQDSF